MPAARFTLYTAAALAVLGGWGPAFAQAPADRAPTVEEINARKAVHPTNTRKGVALKGYDPVAYFADGKPAKGDPAFTATHEGATYQFASAAHRDLFTANPGKYAPQFGGYCAYAISINAIADVDPRQWAVRDGKLYLNNNPIASSLWKRDNAAHIAKGERNWSAYPKAADAPEKFD